MAFIAIDEASGEMLGGVRIHDANYQNAEYAILVRSDLQGHGIGWLLMRMILEYARDEGLRRISGQVLRENTTMLAMCAELGFHSAPDPDDPGIVDVSLDLGDAPPRSAPGAPTAAGRRRSRSPPLVRSLHASGSACHRFAPAVMDGWIETK